MAVRNRMFLGVQDIDFVQISDPFFPNFASILLKSNQFAQIYLILSNKIFGRGCGCISCIPSS